MSVVVSAVAALAFGSTLMPAEATPRADHPGATAIAVPSNYLTQQLQWRPCNPEDAPGGGVLECAQFLAPLDWDNAANGESVTIAASRLRSANGQPKGSVFVNPGGPGGPGVEFPLFFQQAGRTKLVDNMELIGFDVRGTGRSSSVTCGGLGGVREDLDPRDRSPQNLERLLAASANIASSCQTASRELGRFVNTEQTVFDLDLLRRLLGRDKIHWFGYSAGSWLGAYYATYFPSRVGRFAFDSNSNFTATQQENYLSQPMGFERRFRADFLPWAASHDDVLHLGASAPAVLAGYERLRARLTDAPVDLGDGTIVHPNTLDYVFTYGVMYSKYAFPFLADLLVTLNDLVFGPGGPGTQERAKAATLAVKQAVRTPNGPATAAFDDSFLSTYWTVICNDTPWTTGRDFILAESERQGRQFPLAGWNTVSDPLACSSWDRPELTMPVPNGAGLPPILMVQSEHDPATPIEGALRAHQEFESSRLVTVVGEGDHGIYAHDNVCVDTIVERFLVDGVAPATDVTCQGLPIPDPNPQPQR